MTDRRFSSSPVVVAMTRGSVRPRRDISSLRGGISMKSATDDYLANAYCRKDFQGYGVRGQGRRYDLWELATIPAL